ncbi:MAG TPA: DUF6279 family lipoprotein, partial [Albitalea sp.]|nr:DUF6279 family lipoprotein [Albitalea sp.]
VDFTDAQEPAARDAIAAWFKWHRTTQLRDYAELLRRTERQALEPTTGAQVCHWVDEAGTRADRAVEQAIDIASDLLRNLTPEQLAHLERKYAKANAEFVKEYLQSSGEERLKASVKRVIDRTEFFYGKLEPAQRDRIVQGVANSPFDPEAWMIERKLRQQEVLQTLRRLSTEHASVDDAQAALKAVYEHARRSPREPYRAYQQRLADTNCMLAAEVHNLTTPAQRREMAKRLKSWESDLRQLAAG